jgi:hypothetical protein
MRDELPLTSFIVSRCRELGFRKVDLIVRAGYKNRAKGLRRLDALLDGNLDAPQEMMSSLPRALSISELEFHLVVEQTRLLLEEEKQKAIAAAEAHWRATFIPHAIIVTEQDRPSSIWLAAVLGVSRILRIDFDGSDPSNFVDQALEGAARRPIEFSSDPDAQRLPAFGRPRGVIVNYSPVYAVRYDLEGEMLESMPRAHRLGEARLFMDGRIISSKMLNMQPGSPP